MNIQNRILAVDDNLTNLSILDTLLDDDYCLKTAESGEEALEIATSFRPDLVLLDIMMPGIDGYETCRRLRRDPALRHTKIIMVSAKAMLNERLEGYDVGADDYVTKPFDHDELLAKVRVYLRLKSAEEVEQVKGKVIEILQHSTRAPLTTVISYAEMLCEMPDIDESKRTEFCKGILRSSRRLHLLLEKGETLAAMKAHKFTYEFESRDFCSLVENTINVLQPELFDRDLTFRLDVPNEGRATFDYVQMQFVVRALLDNAIRFSPDGGTIDVSVTLSDGEISLQVADQGEGISPELIARVFEEFGDPDSPLHNQGDGLSLAIVREIITAHGGHVSVESEPGAGAAFTVQFDSSVSETCQLSPAFA